MLLVVVLFDPTAESGHCDICIYKYCTHQLQNQRAHLKRKIKHINYCNALSFQLPLFSAHRISKSTLIQIQRQRVYQRNTCPSWECYRKSWGMWIQLHDIQGLSIIEKTEFPCMHSTLCHPLPIAAIYLSQNTEMWALTARVSQEWIDYCCCPCQQQIQNYYCLAWFSVWKNCSSHNLGFIYLFLYIWKLGLCLG